MLIIDKAAEGKGTVEIQPDRRNSNEEFPETAS